MNDVRWRLYGRLKGTGLPVKEGSGGRTKQRTVHGFGCDALCVDESTPDDFTSLPVCVQILTAVRREKLTIQSGCNSRRRRVSPPRRSESCTTVREDGCQA